MTKIKGTLLDKKRFAVWEREKRRWLRNLSLRKAIRLEESLLSSDFSWAWQKNLFQDKPKCLKDSLKKKK